MIIYAILLNLPLAGLRGTNPPATIVLGISALVMGLVGLLRLTSGLHYATGKKALAVVLQFIPLVNIVALAVLSSRATKILRAAGFEVGWLGASGKAQKPLQDGELTNDDALPVAQRLIAFAKRQWVILFLMLLLIFALIIQKVMFSESKSDISKEMTIFVNKTNKDLPKKMDSDTTLTKVEFDGSTFRMNYTKDPGIYIEQSEKEAFKSIAAKQICGGNMKTILANNITIEYLYTFNPDGGADQTMSIAIRPNSCK